MESKIVKSKLLLTAAALLAGVGLASAQGTREGGPGGGMGGASERGMSHEQPSASDRVTPGESLIYEGKLWLDPFGLWRREFMVFFIDSRFDFCLDRL